MIRKAFVMLLKEGKDEEYFQRHNPIWPELETVLKEHGVHNYSIFLLPGTRQLLGYVEIESEEKWAAIARTNVCKRWWAYMADIMPTNPDNSPVSIETKEMFHLE